MAAWKWWKYDSLVTTEELIIGSIDQCPQDIGWYSQKVTNFMQWLTVEFLVTCFFMEHHMLTHSLHFNFTNLEWRDENEIKFHD